MRREHLVVQVAVGVDLIVMFIRDRIIPSPRLGNAVMGDILQLCMGFYLLVSTRHGQ